MITPPTASSLTASADSLAALIDADRWAQLAAGLAQATEPGEVWLRTLARNLAELQAFRPALYGRIKAELPHVAFPESVHLANPEASDDHAFAIFDATKLLRQHGRSVALGGIGDGRVLRAHARHPPSLILNRQQEVMLIEPDFARLLIGLGMTDQTGPRGPIRQMRFSWYLGTDWVENLAQDLIDQPARIPPMRIEAVGELRPELSDGLAEVEARLKQAEAQRKAQIGAYYDALDDEELLAVLGPNPPRPPRMLMPTSQFSSVLQYSTADSADALRQLGWDVLIVTETDVWQSMGPSAVQAAIASFKPDAVFHIDHLRYEMPDIFPAKLPHICWIQDHLANLTNEAAGASMGERDFALTGATYRYVTRHGYPRRQCIDMAKSSRPPALPLAWTCDREDVFYVSHWSNRAETVVHEMCQRTRDLAGAVGERAMYECCSEMFATYARGDAFPTMHSVRGIVRAVFARLGVEGGNELEHFFVDALFLRLNNVLYRQQALTWAGEICDALGLRFGIYGRDWDTHPTLGNYARGVVQYGPDLERLTRESKILLQLEPYACYSHQRMLDALLAGGFTLVRKHPFNYLPIKVRQFLDAYVPDEIRSVESAMEVLAPPLRESFATLLDEAQEIAAMGDVVDVVRGWQRSGLIGNGDMALPCLDAVSFDSKASLDSLIRQFISDDDLRRSIAATQRQSVMERFTYVQTLKGAMRHVRDLLHDTFQTNQQPLTRREAA